MTAFWDMEPCRLEVDGSFRAAYCLHYQDDADGDITHLSNVDLFQRVYTEPYPRRLSSSD
jgi:hypothetical protein